MTEYRREIDGLRAIAVLPVILFHAGFGAFSGGYVGVDVFFVISGYLITSIIVSERRAGSFSIAKFYERRARRILPALTLVVLCCLPFAWFWMLPFQLEELGRGMAAVGVFGSNILFWLKSGYFDTAGAENPLLHTWSLAVEEQYYLLFPLLILALWPRGMRRLALSLCGVGAISLGVAHLLRHDPSATFYLLPTRAWELVAGSLVAIRVDQRGLPQGRWNDPLAAVGLALILFGVFRYDEMTPFPSVWSAAPVAGTALVILFANGRTLTGRLLSLRPMVGIGLVSYSAYLWHQPLFAFARIRSTDSPSPWTMLALAALCLLLAYVSWRHVEQPFRDRARYSRRHIFSFGAAATALLIVLGAAAHFTEGFKGRYTAEQLRAAASEPREGGAYVKHRYNAEVRDKAFTQLTKTLLLIGDSYAQDFYNMILETGAFPGYEIAAVHFPARCQLYLGKGDVSRHIEPSARATCRKLSRRQSMIDRARVAEVVIFAFSWKQWSADGLAETLSHFSFRPGQKVLILGRKRFGRVTVHQIRDLSIAERSALRLSPSTEHLDVNASMRKTVPPDMFIDTHQIICGDGPLCPVFTPDGDLISFDTGHLTPAGAKYIGELLFNSPKLREYGPAR